MESTICLMDGYIAEAETGRQVKEMMMAHNAAEHPPGDPESPLPPIELGDLPP